MAWKKLDRRHFLKGSGALITLPFLEAMLPFRALAQTPGVPLRTMFVQFPYGSQGTSLSPTGSGTNYNFPVYYSSLNPYKASLTPIRFIYNHWGGVDGAGDHARGQGTYLTGVRINKSENNIRNATSVDQMIANAVGNQTKIKSLYFSGWRGFGGDSGYSSVYMNMSWINATTANSRAGDPHQVFDTLFGDGNNDGPQNLALINRLKKRKSILDDAVAESQRLISSLGSSDRAKMDQYLTSLREVEQKVSRDLSDDNTGVACNVGQRPGQNLNFALRTQIFFDLMVLAAQCDSTRVFAYLMGTPGNWSSILGISGDHHNDMSHHAGNQGAINNLRATNTWYAEQFATFLQKMSTTTDVNGQSLLYNSMISFGSDMRDGNQHDDRDIAFLVAGNAGGKFTPGKIINNNSDINISNVWLTFMQTVGMNVNSFGEGQGASNGTVAL